MTTFIGLAGLAGVGKDTAAQALIEKGWQRTAFADPLRELIGLIDPFVEADGEEFAIKRISLLTKEWGALPAETQQSGFWTWLKSTPYETHARELRQRFGQAARDVLGEDVWVVTLMNKVIDAKTEAYESGGLLPIVVTDVRYMNEAATLKGNGAVLIRIRRDDVVQDVSGHPSETSLTDENFPYDAIIDNNGTIEELHARLLQFVESV